MRAKGQIQPQMIRRQKRPEIVEVSVEASNQDNVAPVAPGPLEAISYQLLQEPESSTTATPPEYLILQMTLNKLVSAVMFRSDF